MLLREISAEVLVADAPIVALTPDGRLPIVRQYRPALEQFTWELPAGMVDQGEAAADCCRRDNLPYAKLMQCVNIRLVRYFMRRIFMPQAVPRYERNLPAAYFSNSDG